MAIPSSGQLMHFYPRPPRGGRRVLHRKNRSRKKFLSTPSARRATLSAFACVVLGKISIHALREEGDLLSIRQHLEFCISIHALREEGDCTFCYASMPATTFLSTPSARRATSSTVENMMVITISIHALREEGDPAAARLATKSSYFYPRPPRGGRPGQPFLGAFELGISIHALREEGDRGSVAAQ